MPPRSWLRFWLPPLLWIAVIFTASSASFSSANTAPWLGRLVQSIFGHPISASTFDTLHYLIRKAGHLTEYGILGALLFRAIRAGRTGWDWRWMLAAVAIAAIVGGLDEWHQAFVPGRTSTPWDTLIDTVGAVLAQVLFFRT
jgi:VanZ family protein